MTSLIKKSVSYSFEIQNNRFDKLKRWVHNSSRGGV